MRRLIKLEHDSCVIIQKLFIQNLSLVGRFYKNTTVINFLPRTKKVRRQNKKNKTKFHSARHPFLALSFLRSLDWFVDRDKKGKNLHACFSKSLCAGYLLILFRLTNEMISSL